MLVGLLVAMMLLQLALTRDPGLPSESAGRAPGMAVDVAVRSIPASPEILTRPLFSPTRRGGNPAGASADAPWGDVTVAGMVSGRGFARAMLRLPDGTVQSVPLGGGFRGWRLEALTTEAARFGKDGQHIKISYGSRAEPAAEATSEEQ